MSSHPRRRRAARAGIVLAATVAAAACAATPASAAFIAFGSDLTAPANRSDPHPVDTAFWQLSLPDGSSGAAPAGGQIVQIKLKGIALPAEPGSSSPANCGAGTASCPYNIIHFQRLAPQPGGTVQAQATAGNQLIPYSGDPNQITTYNMVPANLCIAQGDYLSFADAGGFTNADPMGYPNGVNYQVFSSTPGASTAQQVFGDPNVHAPTTLAGTELLLQAVVATGPDASGLCPGGQINGAGHPAPPGITVGSPGGTTPPGGTAPPPKTTRSGGPHVRLARHRARLNRHRRVRLKLVCPPGDGPYTGRVKLRTLGRHRTTLGAWALSCSANSRTRVSLKVSRRRYRRALRGRHRQRAKAVIGVRNATGTRGVTRTRLRLVVARPRHHAHHRRHAH
jgi:hypothetical protein